MTLTDASDGSLRVRRAGDNDAPGITQLVAAAYEHYRPLIGRTPLPMLTNYEITIREHEVWVLEAGDSLVGVLDLEPKADHLWLDNVAVHPAAQRRGHGRRLLEHAEAIARDAGYEEIRLLTNERYLDNIAMYLRRGYVETHRAPYAGTDLVYFSKRLADGW
jgi:N-acetylglutamate synthase-like GNAT family acetyltransferase